METYIVGGAVRDFLFAKLNGQLNSQAEIREYWSTVEKDWVVVGSTPEEMMALGFKPVGKSFPVFLNPQTYEEYALARTERKTGHGYTGFECYASSEVTLLEDLKRRDLTINAIAAPENIHNITFQSIIDPYGGLDDLKKRRFKHVSSAFVEDPVRILRIARLATRFGDFTVDPATLELMRNMVSAGEVDALIPERVWQEWERSLKEKFPWRFFEILEQCGARNKLFPEIQNLVTKKSMLKQAVSSQAEEEILLAIQLYDLENTAFEKITSKYRIPNHYAEIVGLIVKNYPAYHHLYPFAPRILAFLQQTDAFRRPNRFNLFLKTCHYLSRKETPHFPLNLLKVIWQELLKIDHHEIINKGFKGKEIAAELKRIRINKIESLL